MEAVSMDAQLKIVKILSFGKDANLGDVDAEHPRGSTGAFLAGPAMVEGETHRCNATLRPVGPASPKASPRALGFL
jgi:hypothetical protein